MTDNIRISKKTLGIVAVIVVIAILAGAYLIWYAPKLERQRNVEEYKKTIFDSILCQYSCPIVDVQIQNQTATVPEPACIRNCTRSLQAIGAKRNEYSEEEVLGDKMFEELDNTLNGCKEQSKNQSDGLNGNNTLLFECGKAGLLALKANYTYLN